MVTILVSYAFIGNCWVSGQGLQSYDYFSAIREEKAKAQVVEKIDELGPHPIQSSLASSLVSQIQTWGKMPATF